LCHGYYLIRPLPGRLRPLVLIAGSSLLQLGMPAARWFPDRQRGAAAASLPQTQERASCSPRNTSWRRCWRDNSHEGEQVWGILKGGQMCSSKRECRPSVNISGDRNNAR